MIDISVHQLHKHYGSNHVIKGVSFEIYKGEKVGLLGKNGSGKTTLFKIIADDEPYDSGNVSKASDKKMEVLAQIPDFGTGTVVEDILRSSFSEIYEIHDAMKKLEGDENPAALTRYGKLMDQYERLGGYDFEYKIDKICNGIKIDSVMRQKQFGLLSGGEKTRVNLARILLRECDILLLDEPTNHLDLESLRWLEGFIRDFNGTVVVISHDRVFLDNIITRIIEIEVGKAHFYSGNYTWYVEEKRRRYQLQLEQYERQQKEIKRIEERAKWLVDNNRYTTKHHALLSRLDHMEKIEKPHTARKVSGDFTMSGHIAKEVVSFESVHKSYDTNVLLDDVSLTIGRNDRIALIGANGCGKTTLLKIMMGEEGYDSGNIKVSSNTKIAYMSQNITFDDANATVLETMYDTLGLAEHKLRSILSRFNFHTDDIAKKVSVLSGGEKSRLRLCLLMQGEANFLILDEPTNHLDIDSREWIEDAVAGWDGTLLFISHDRYFLGKFASKVWQMEGGAISEYVGSFEEYLAKTSPEASTARQPAKGKKKVAPNVAQPPAKPTLDEQINHAETELAETEREIEEISTSEDYDKMDELFRKKFRIEEHISTLYSDLLSEEDMDNQEK